LTILSFSACKQELPVNFGEVQGTILNELTNQPQADIKVYLLDQAYRADSANSNHDQIALDSILTDQNGFYLFDSLASGSYSVVPFSLSMSMVHVESSDPYDFEVSASERYQVDYIAAPNAMNFPFTIDVHFTNVPDLDYYQLIDTYIIRRFWVSFMPNYMEVPSEHVGRDENNEYHLNIRVPGGFTAIFYTLENYFDIYAEIFWDNHNRGQIIGSFILETSILDFTPVVKWEFDCETKILTRIQ